MGSVLLPIAPEKFTLKVKNNNKTITLINEGEVNILHDAGLTELEFDALIPAVQYSFANYDGGFKSPAYFTNYFEKLKLEKKPFQFIVVRKMPNEKLLFDTNMTVAMESYTIKENAKDGFDLVVSFKLKQYKFYGTKIVKVIENTAVVETPRQTDNSPAPKQDTTYTVKKGDTLWNIAKKTYGDGSKYKEIYEHNMDSISNPNLIHPNQKLVLPASKTKNRVELKG
jgi:LysM repeat protein